MKTENFPMAWDDRLRKKPVGGGCVGQVPEQQQAGQLGRGPAGRELGSSAPGDPTAPCCQSAHPMCMKG